jgi:hypothetical protein
MVTVLAVVVNTTRAVVVGPRVTLLAVKPCCGLHDSRKAAPVAHCATTVPPDELRTVPLVLAVRPDPPVPAPLVPLARLVPAALRWDRDIGEDDGAATWLACACAEAGTRDCWLAGEAEMPAPSSDTRYRPPAAAAAAPSPHAPAPMTIRVRMVPRSPRRR